MINRVGLTRDNLEENRDYFILRVTGAFSAGVMRNLLLDEYVYFCSKLYAVGWKLNGACSDDRCCLIYEDMGVAQPSYRCFEKRYQESHVGTVFEFFATYTGKCQHIGGPEWSKEESLASPTKHASSLGVARFPGRAIRPVWC